MSTNSLPQRLRAWCARPEVRALALDVAPFALLFGAVWVKLSYFNFPPLERIANDWDGWRPVQAVEAILASLAPLLILCAPLLLLRRSGRLVAIVLLDLAVTALVVANVIHFRFYGDVISVSALSAAGQVGYIADSIAALLRPTDVLFFADLLLAAALLRRYRAELRAAPVPDPRRVRTLARRAVVAGLVLIAALPVRIVALDREGNFHYNYYRFFGVQEIGLLNYHFYEAGRRITREVTLSRVSEAETARAEDFLREWRTHATARSDLFGVAAGKNLVLVMVEALHDFPIGMRIEGQEVTPFLNEFAARSLYFDRFYDQTWEGTTSDGEFTSLQSLHPLPSGAVPTTYPGNEYRGLPEVLAERGYDTFSAHAYWGDLWNMRKMHPNLGFRRSYFLEAYELTEKFGQVLSDGEFFRQTLPRLEEAGSPFMAYLMTISTHHPYRLPERYRTLRLGDLEGTQLGDYLHTLHYLDAAFEEFVGELERTGLLDESVLVVYGDHKAKLGAPEDLEALLTRHASYPPRGEGLDARYWSAENRLPLLIRLPGGEAAGRRSVTGGHVDIAPTVLNLLGIEDHSMATLGRDLTRGEDSFVVLRNGSFVKGDTLCVTLDGSVQSAACRHFRTGEALAPSGLADLFADARTRLEVSDLIHRGDLLRALAPPAAEGRLAGQ